MQIESHAVMEEFGKMYYKISDVAEMLGVATSTLRYWEKEFPGISPRRSRTNQRYYSPENIRKLRIINYLVRDKGLRIEAAKEELEKNSDNVSRRFEIIDILKDTRNQLQEMLSALNKRK